MGPNMGDWTGDLKSLVVRYGAMCVASTELGVPVCDQNGSLIGSRSMPKDKARWKSAVYIHLAISESATW
jgi:hypothetical protein